MAAQENKRIYNDHRKLALTPETAIHNTNGDALCFKVEARDERGRPISFVIEARVHWSNRNFMVRIPNFPAHELMLDDKDVVVLTVRKKPNPNI